MDFIVYISKVYFGHTVPGISQVYPGFSVAHSEVDSDCLFPSLPVAITFRQTVFKVVPVNNKDGSDM